MDVMSPGHPVRNIWLQTVEALRDTSHVQNYASGEWLSLITEAGLIARALITDRLPLEFSSWIARMRTPEALSQAIRLYQESASAEVKAYFELQDDGSFTSDTIMAEAQKADKQKRHRGESVPFYLSIVLSGVWRRAVLHKQRQLVARFQIVSIIVPAHHILDVHAVPFCDTGQ